MAKCLTGPSHSMAANIHHLIQSQPLQLLVQHPTQLMFVRRSSRLLYQTNIYLFPYLSSTPAVNLVNLLVSPSADDCGQVSSAGVWEVESDKEDES